MNSVCLVGRLARAPVTHFEGEGMQDQATWTSSQVSDAILVVTGEWYD